MSYSITINQKFNSLEITFDSKPSEAIREVLKSFSFRWNPKKSIWYGFAEREELENALACEEVKKAPKARESRYSLPSLWERTRTENIPEHNRREATKEVAKQTRDHFKKLFPELKISCRIGKGGWAAYNEVNFEFIAGPYAKDSEAFKAIESYTKSWLWSFNYDNSDSMTDYFDRNFYESISAYSYTETEATEDQINDIDNFNNELAKAKAEEEKRAEAEYIARMAQLEEERKEAEKRAASREIKKKEVISSVIVKDIKENDHYIIEGMMLSGIGKECTTEEITERGTEKEESAIITRELHFSSMEIYNNFCELLLCDFDFLDGFGGSCALDSRLEGIDFYKLNAEQRESVKWYIANGVAVYVNNVLMLVIDPQGYSYARYTYMVTDYTRKTLKEAEKEEEQTERDPFYMPEQIATQADAIENGEQYTLVYIDPWILSATMHHVKITNHYIKDYAQHKNSLYLEYIESGKRKPILQQFNNDSTVLIYRGHLASVPESLTRRNISGNMYEVLNAGMGVHDFMKNVYKYFKAQNITPIVNTMQF